MVAEEDPLCQSLSLMLKYFQRINEERDKEEERSINSNKVKRHNAIQVFQGPNFHCQHCVTNSDSYDPMTGL